MNDSIEVEQTRRLGRLLISVRIRYETAGRIYIPTRAAELKAVVTEAVQQLGVDTYEPITNSLGIPETADS